MRQQEDGDPGAATLTPDERAALIKAVEPWQEFSASFYVDRYIGPAVAQLLASRLAAATELADA